MAWHQFGIMNKTPQVGERYDTYDPENYDCISVHDDLIEPLLECFEAIDCYWHTPDRLEKGLAYCGITLIPPASIPAFLRILDGQDALTELAWLMEQARRQDRFVIHFGI